MTSLTKLELDVLHLAACGKTTQKIADELHYGYHYITHNKGQIISKLNAKNITHAVAIAIRTGLIAPPTSVGKQRYDRTT